MIVVTIKARVSMSSPTMSVWNTGTLVVRVESTTQGGITRRSVRLMMGRGQPSTTTSRRQMVCDTNQFSIQVPAKI